MDEPTIFDYIAATPLILVTLAAVALLAAGVLCAGARRTPMGDATLSETLAAAQPDRADPVHAELMAMLAALRADIDSAAFPALASPRSLTWGCSDCKTSRAVAS